MTPSTNHAGDTPDARSSRQDAVSRHKRDLILSAAKSVFEEEGLEGASLRQIAAAAGYTTGALYSYFESKEAMYGALLDESLERLQAAVAAAADAQRTPNRTFVAAVTAYFDFYTDNPRDLDLGFYLFRGGMRPRGLSSDSDAALNDKLLAALGPATDAVKLMGASDEDALLTMADVFAHASGLLLLQQTGRVRIFPGTSARELLIRHLDRLLASGLADGEAPGTGGPAGTSRTAAGAHDDD